jgi:multidrug efflux pump
MKSFTDLFIKRPVLAMVVSFVILIAGSKAILPILFPKLGGLGGLNVRQYPRSDIASISITTVYVGADADLVRGFITTPLERAIAAADGIDYIQSQSKQGQSQITVRLKLNYDANKALSDISSKVDAIRRDLPPESEIPVIEIQSADTQRASAYLSFTSDILQPNEVTDYLVRLVQPRLTAVGGVQKADILGGRYFAMRIWMKPDRMAALNISPAQVRSALSRNNFLSAIGSTKGSLLQVNLTANTDLHTADDFKKLVVRQDKGTLVRLGDIADVVLGAEDYNAEVRFSGQKAVFMGIYVLPNANSVDVIKRVRAEMEQIKRELPSGLTAEIAYDSTAYINDAIHEVVKTLIDTLLIVMLVIFLFLGSFRSVIVPVVAIPISLIGAMFLMQMFGFSLNLLTLLAIVLSVGLVVDDAIVVVENVERHMREGMSRMNAAIKGARELVGPIIAMTLTLATVYTPIALQGGLTGALFREFALTLAGAVFISGVVALTLSPMMSAHLLRSEHVDHGFSGWVNRTFDRFRDWYGSHLDRTLNARPAVYLVWGGVSALALFMFIMIPSFASKELAPTEDQGVIFGIVTAPANATIDDTIRYADAAEKVFLSVPDTRFTFQITFPDNGFGGMVLKPWGVRKTPTADYLPVVQHKLGDIPGIQLFPVMPSALPGSDSFPVSFVIASTADPERILEFAKQLYGKAMAAHVFQFADIDTKIDQPQAQIDFDHDKVAALGLDMQQVGADLTAAIGGNYVNRFNIAGRSYKVIPQIKRVDRLNPQQLENIYVTGPNNKLIPLSTVATIKHRAVARSLNRMQQLNAVTISGVPARSIDAALKFLEDEARKMLPKGYVIDYTGESRQLRTEGDKFVPVFVLSIVLIFLVLAAQFNSFRDPFIVLPLALFGAVIFMFLKMPFGTFFTSGWTTSLNIYSQVGLVTLVGLVSRNGILIVQFANEMQRKGMDKLTAVAQAARIRLRPIMMTSAATVAGHFPLTLVTGAGAAARNSIGLVLVGGMTIGTIFTLFIVPSLYMLLAKEHHEKSLMDVGWDDTPEDVDLAPAPEMAPALAPDGNGNGWKK